MRRLLLASFLVVFALAPVAAEEPVTITLASTTSTDNSGLLDAILPRFEAESGIRVQVVAVGTGQALRLARAGDADALLVHDRDSEERFVAEGYGLERVEVMANDFVVVAPADSDPAGVVGGSSIVAALGAIAKAQAPFLSRGDDSGTHKAELRLWRAAGIDPSAASGSWYRETGAGMGGTLNTAAGMGAYTLSDRGTYVAFRNRAGLRVAVENDPLLENPYGVIAVNPARHPHVNAAAAKRFVAWMASPTGQRAIGGFRVDGEQLFFPRNPPPED